MAALCAGHGIALLCYGTLAGGFLSNRYLGMADPGSLENRSLVKYRLAAPALRLHAAVPYLNGSRLFEVGDEVAAGWEPRQAVVVPR